MVEPSILAQALINGLLLGGIYSLVSVGLTLIYGVMDIVNFAHGAFMMLSMYLTFWLFVLFGVHPLISLPIAFIVFFAAGMAVQRTVIQRALEGPMAAQMLVTFGLLLIIENSALFSWSALVRTISVDYSNLTFFLGSISISAPRLIAFIAAIIASLLLHLFLTKTDLGLAIRATAQNREAARLAGINIKFIYSIAFGLGLGLAAIAGNLVATFYYITPSAGTPFLLAAFVVAVLGGLGNYVGALFGGLIIGIVESMAGTFLLPAIRQLVYLAVFYIILVTKPEGLLGKTFERKA